MAAPIILCDTAGMDEKRWLECRAHGPKGNIEYTVGGSDVATIFGLSPWMTPLELWHIKKGYAKPPVKANANQLEMGHLLEPIAAHWYQKKTGNIVTDDTFLYQHADHPYALANFDRRIARASDGEAGILECKSCTYHKAEEWADEGYPEHYEIQLRFYLSVADVSFGAFSAIWGNNLDHDMAMPEIQRDQAKEDIIFERLDQWIWSLKNDKPPKLNEAAPKVALEYLARVYQKSDPVLPTIELPAKHESALRVIAAEQAAIAERNRLNRESENRIAAHSVNIIALMKAHEHGVLETTDDHFLIEYVTRTSRRTDTALLKSSHPSVYESTLKTSTSRKLKVSIQPN